MIKRVLKVKSTVIDWQLEALEVTDNEGRRWLLPLSKDIHAVMIGYPDQQERDMLARDLAPYMTQGYMIKQISFDEEDEANAHEIIVDLLEQLPVNYPKTTLTRNAEGYTLEIDRTIIFQRATGEDAIKHTQNYVDARKGHPDLPIGVIYGVYD